MTMKLNNVVPFGRSLDEYRGMFGLSETDLHKKILGIGDGPASFNAEMRQQGHHITSIDPLYTFKGNEIEHQFYAVLDGIIEQVRQSPDDWVWTYHKSPDHLKKNRVRVTKTFIADFEKGKQEQRYIVGELPKLDIEANQFDITLCSHLLFLYSDHLSYAFHLASILEMLRIAKEVRIFPLLTLQRKKSPYLKLLLKKLRSQGYTCDIETTKYELQKGGNERLTINKHT